VCGSDFCSTFSTGGSSETETYLVILDDETSLKDFRMTGTDVLVDYGNGFYITRSTESEAIALGRLGSVIRMSTMLDMYPSDIVFDTSDSPPTTSSPMEKFDWDRETYIVQFVGPYKPEWLDWIEKEGGNIAKLAPTYSAVVKISPLVKSRIAQLPYVKWVGAYKHFYKISSELLESEGGVRVAVRVFDESQRILATRKLVEMGASVIVSSPPSTIIVYTDSGLLPWIASMPEVMDVRRDHVPKPTDLMSARIHGAFDSWETMRSGLPSSLTGQSPGPDGIEGTSDDYFEIFGIQDTGLDVCNQDNGHPDFFKGPHGDRVFRMVDQTGLSCPDGLTSGLSHGTQVSGTVIGNGFAWESHLGEPTDDDDWERSEGVGIVPEGRISFDGIVGFGGSLMVSPMYWDIQYADGAHVTVNAFAGAPDDYGSYSWDVDDRTDVDNDRLMVFATANEGPELNSISSFAQGKNGLTSGASLNFRPDRPEAYNPNIVADFSGRGGPNQSYGRLKPDLITVGTQAVSLMGTGEWDYNTLSGKGNPQDDCIMHVDLYNNTDPDNLNGDGICDYRYYEFGTSVSTPNLGGLTMLVREYLREVGGISNPYQINSQLVKALLINGAVRMDEDLFDYPGYDQGWGSVDLVQSLFPRAPRTNKYEEGLMTVAGVWNPSFETVVHTDGVPLKVTLVWVDEAGKGLYRDLNLKAISPSGDIYYGNVYGSVGLYDGWSIPNPSSLDSNPLWDRIGDDGWDDVNNVEQVEVEFPEPGPWTIEVIGFALPSEIPFALVAGADFGPQQAYDVELTTDHPRALEAAPSGDVLFPFSVTNFGTDVDDLVLDVDAPPGIDVDFENQLLTDVKSRETVDTYVLITVLGVAVCGSHVLSITAMSMSDSAAVDQFDIELAVECDKTPRRWQITNGTTDEMEPAVLTFNDGLDDHIFIAYWKTTSIAPDNRFGGRNVWVAHTTLDGEGFPNFPITHTEVSNWSDDPIDIRLTYVPQGTYQNRVILTWTGDDPEAVDERLDSYGVLYYSDPPYSTWNRRIIERNAGSYLKNEARINKPLWRDDGTPGGEVIWIWEQYDYSTTAAHSPISIQIWYAISRDGGDTWPICDGSDPDCGRLSPYDLKLYYYPDACVDMHDVLWVFFYTRPQSLNEMDLAVRLYNGTWQGDSTPINPNDDTSLLWNTDRTDLKWPTCVASSEGTSGNRMYVGVADDVGGVDYSTWVGYLEGNYNATNPPFGLNISDVSGISPNLHGPWGPMGLSISYANRGRGQMLNMVTTNDSWTWVSYIENMNDFGTSNLITTATTDSFNAVREYSNLTGDVYAKGHQTTDSLTVNLTRHNVYEVFHMSKRAMRDVDYDIYLVIYHRNWESAPDSIGPVVDPILAIPNPFNVSTTGQDITLLACVSDIDTGMSNIKAAEWKEVPLSVTDPTLIDWSGAQPMSIGTDSPIETGVVVWKPSTWDSGETHRLCARGQDEFDNWGIGACVDVITIGKKPILAMFDLTFTTSGWYLISIPLSVSNNSIGHVFQNITGKFDELRVYDAATGKWSGYQTFKSWQTLTSVDNTIGIWIHITQGPCTLHVEGNLTQVTEITLQPGWNLIGYPSLNATGMTVGDLLNNPTVGIDRVEGYDGLNPPYYLKELAPSYYLQPGEGYWVRVDSAQPVVLQVPGF
jgi:hypothetical protein